MVAYANGLFNPLPTIGNSLTLYQPMTAFAVMVSHKPIRIYMGVLILGVILNLVHGFCLFKLYLMVGKELKKQKTLYKVLMPTIKPPYKFLWAYGSS